MSWFCLILVPTKCILVWVNNPIVNTTLTMSQCFHGVNDVLLVLVPNNTEKQHYNPEEPVSKELFVQVSSPRLPTTYM